MHVHDVLFAGVVPHLANGFQERKRLDVADRTADLDDADLGAAGLGKALDVRLDLVGDVGDDLNGSAQVVAAALFFDDGVVDLAGRHVVGVREVLVDEAFVMA